MVLFVIIKSIIYLKLHFVYNVKLGVEVYITVIHFHEMRSGNTLIYSNEISLLRPLQNWILTYTFHIWQKIISSFKRLEGKIPEFPCYPIMWWSQWNLRAHVAHAYLIFNLKKKGNLISIIKEQRPKKRYFMFLVPLSDCCVVLRPLTCPLN